MNKSYLKSFIFIISFLFLSIIAFSKPFNNKSKAIADDAYVECQGIANDENNNILETKAQGNPLPIYRTLLKYNIALGETANAINVVSSTGEGILLNGIKLSEIPNTIVDYANGSKYLRIKIPQEYQDNLRGPIILEVIDGTMFEGKILDGIKFQLTNGRWEKLKEVAFSNIVWNEIGYDYYQGKKGILLGFDQFLSDKSEEYNGKTQATNFALTVGENILLGGLKLSTLPGAMVSYHSQGLLFIYCDNMSVYRTLTINSGTPILNALLPEVKLYYEAKSKWTTTIPLVELQNVDYSGIVWNEIGYDLYANMNGVLLNFSKFLSDVPYEYDGGVESTDLTPLIGDNILLGGIKISSIPGAFISYHSQGLLFIYVSNMQAYRTLEIKDGTQLFNSILPNVKLYYSQDTKWTTDYVLSYTQVEFDSIVWNEIGYDFYQDKKGILLGFNKNLSNVFIEINARSQEVDFTKLIGDKIYLGGIKLSDIDGAFISYHSQYLLFIYAPGMSLYRTLKIESGAKLLNAILPEVNLYFNSKVKWTVENNEEIKENNFSKIAWNNTSFDEFYGKNGVLLTFEYNLSNYTIEFNGAYKTINLVNTSIGEKIKLGGTPIKNLEGAEVTYHSLGNLWIYAKDMTTYLTLEIEETTFLDVTLPKVELAFNGAIWQDASEPVIKYAYCIGIANDENNNIPEPQNVFNPVPVYRTLLRYDIVFNDNPNTVNVVGVIGDHFLLNGVELSKINNTLIDFANGSKYLRIKIPQAYLDSLDNPILEVLPGAIFEGYTLDGIKFVLRNGQWATYMEPKAVSFKTILWNNTGKDIYENKNGILLSFSNNLSNVSNEIKGFLKEVNYKDSLLGDNILLDGEPLKNINGSEIMYFGSSFLWIYVPNMDTYKELEIRSTTFLESILPKLKLAFINNEWTLYNKINSTINGLEFITYVKHNTQLLNEEFFNSLYSNNGISYKLISFTINGKEYSSNSKYKVDNDVFVNAVMIGFETLTGASVKISTPSALRFSSIIDKESFDYIVDLYGLDNIEIGTLVTLKSSISLSSIRSYFNNPELKIGTDYYKLPSSLIDLGSNYKYFGTFDGINLDDLTTKYLGIGYIKILSDDKTYIIYGDDIKSTHERSIYDVDIHAYKDYKIDSIDSVNIKNHLDNVVSIINSDGSLSLDSNIESYQSPFKVSINDNKLIINGDKDFTDCLINGESLNKSNIINLNNNTYLLSDLFKGEEVYSNLSLIDNPGDLLDFLITIPSDREFRILQITDTQIIDSSQMRTMDRLGESAIDLYRKSNIDVNCFNYIQKLIDDQNPDLIIFTGDIVYGEFDDSGEILRLIVDFMDSFNVPWAPVFGNHDNESKMGVIYQSNLFENAKNCLFKKGNLTGNGNYSIGLCDVNGKVKRVIYMLDSGGCLRGAGIGDDQVNWIKNISSNLSSLYGESVPGFAAFHIPSIDFKNAYLEKYSYNENDNFNLGYDEYSIDFGEKNENPSLFSRSLKDDFIEANIDGVFAGHDHVNNFSIECDGIRYTYGTKTGIYDYHNSNLVGGTLIKVNSDNEFSVEHKFISSLDIENMKSKLLTITVMSDLHIDYNDYGSFYCTKSRDKLRQIVSETLSSRFYINLGDTVNSIIGEKYIYYDAISTIKELNLNVYNSNNSGYTDGNRMFYNLLGNHEIAYNYKEEFKDYTIYADGIGNCGVFIEDNLLFVAVDAIFNRNGSDNPADIIPNTEFMIPDKVINYLKAEVESTINSDIKGIVWISHIALKDIDDSKNALLSELKKYGLPMTVLEGHTHIEAYSELKDTETGKVYCKVFTLPAVTLNDSYPYYNITFIDGEATYIDKENLKTIK